MKWTLTCTLMICLISLHTQAQDNPNYDQALAEQLGGDEYGMKSYQLVMLISGEHPTRDDEDTQEAFKGHLANIDRLAKEELLFLAGPFGANDAGYRGLFVLNVSSEEEAKRVLDTDPAISAGYLAYELYPWYGSAALGTFIEQHEKIWQKMP